MIRQLRVAQVKAVLSSIGDTPAILQYSPAQTGSTLTRQSISAIAADCPNLVQVKVEAMPPGTFICALATVAPQLKRTVGYAGLQLIDARRRGAVAVQHGLSFVELIIAAERRISARRGLVATDVCRAPEYALDTEETAMIEGFLEELADALL